MGGVWKGDGDCKKNKGDGVMIDCKKDQIWEILIIPITAIVCVAIKPYLSINQTTTYYVALFSLLICEALLIVYDLKYGLDIFEPLTIISCIYVVMYFVAPINDLASGELLWFGYDLYEMGAKTTLYALIGYLVFYINYTKEFRIGKHRIGKQDLRIRIISSFPEIRLQNINPVTYILTGYIFCFAANVYYLKKYQGSGLLYMLTAGMIGTGNLQKSSADIGFISMFSYCLPTFVLLYWDIGKSRVLKFLLFLPMFMLQVSRGFRFIIIQIVVTFFSYYYLKKKRRPKLFSIIVAGIGLMVPIVIMTLFRNSMRGGHGIDLTSINQERIKYALDAAIWENFRIYKNFYGIVEAVPQRYPFVYLRQILLGTIIMVVPRIGWPNKLSTQAVMSLDELIGRNFYGTGQAYPNLGEYYYAMGVAGIVFFMAIYGIWAKKMKKLYTKSDITGIDIIYYSTLLGTNLQLIIRGYTPSNFWYLLFSVLPVWCYKIISSQKR